MGQIYDRQMMLNKEFRCCLYSFQLMKMIGPPAHPAFTHILEGGERKGNYFLVEKEHSMLECLIQQNHDRSPESLHSDTTGIRKADHAPKLLRTDI